MVRPKSPLLDRTAAADYLLNTWGIKRSPQTLAKLVVTGGGPLYRKAGRTPLYAHEDLDRWAAELLGEPLGGEAA